MKFMKRDIHNSMLPLLFLDAFQIRKITQASSFSISLSLSFDLGLTETIVHVTKKDLILVDGRHLPLPDRKWLTGDEGRTILIFRKGRWEKWQYYDEHTERFYKPIFVAPGKPPTVEISGIKMHVTQDGDPQMDTSRKLHALGSICGRVLDVCSGLGYTAIALSQNRQVTDVYTIERDRVMLRICRENPWSQPMFESSKIRLIIADAREFLRNFPDEYFNAILHDPPRYSLAPQLYEVKFYRELWRVLKYRGKLYHYTGRPQQFQGKGLPERTKSRLKEASFTRVKSRYQGVWAQKL